MAFLLTDELFKIEVEQGTEGDELPRIEIEQEVAWPIESAVTNNSWQRKWRVLSSL